MLNKLSVLGLAAGLTVIIGCGPAVVNLRYQPTAAAPQFEPDRNVKLFCKADNRNAGITSFQNKGTRPLKFEPPLPEALMDAVKTEMARLGMPCVDNRKDADAIAQVALLNANTGQEEGSGSYIANFSFELDLFTMSEQPLWHGVVNGKGRPTGAFGYSAYNPALADAIQKIGPLFHSEGLVDKIFTPRSTGAAAIDKEELSRIARSAAAEAVAALQHPAAPAVENSGRRGSDVDAPRYTVRMDPNKFALVVGISKYRDLPEASFAEQDARAVKRHLLALGYPEQNIVLLAGDHATKSSLEEKLERWLPMNIGDKSTVFVYYSGHGAPDAESREAYLVPWDGDPESLAQTAFPLSRFYKDLNKLPAARVLVALDSCFSGAGGRSVLAKGIKPLITNIDTSVPQGGKLVVFTASGANQVSGTSENQGHGTFTYYFLKGLNGDAAASTGHVTVNSLYDYVSGQVNAAAHRQEREQNPQLLPPGMRNSPLEIR
jgi:hypothetical protein